MLPHGLLLLLCSLCLGSASAEYYSSVESLETLGLMEQELLNETRNYLGQQQQLIDSYRNFLAHITLQHQLALKQPEAYLGDPLQAFALIKRLVNDWNEVHMLMVDKQPVEAYRKRVDSLHTEMTLPDQQELRGAVKGFARLHQLYNFSAVDLANGNVHAEHFDAQLEWPECLEMAVHLYELQHYELAKEWLLVAASLLHELPKGHEQTKQHFLAQVHEYMALIFHAQGDKAAALNLLDAIPQFDATLAVQHTRSYVQQIDAPLKVEHAPHSWYANYTRLCQGKPAETQAKPVLRCYLDSKRHASFVLAPLKVEPVHVDPDINLYHGLLNDEQIDQIFSEADETTMFRSMVGNGEDNSRVDDVRVSQQTWLNYSSPVMRGIKHLVSAISGFDMNNAETMQVANYGMGGQYEPHADYFSEDNVSGFLGNRISTSMFYLSEVERGGYTVFVKLNVFLPPVKGAMVMWHNLHRSLSVDKRTIHAGCPVIVGSKKIGNIWVHSGLQEFRRPCELKNDAYKSQHVDEDGA